MIELSLTDVLRMQEQCDEDGEKCIVSRQAVDEAIARIEELEAEVEQLKWDYDAACSTLESLENEIEELQADNERLQRKVKRLRERPTIPTHNALQEECDGRMVIIKKLQSNIAQQNNDFNAAINHAIENCGPCEARDFLQVWNEGDWDACKEYGFDGEQTK